MSIIKKFIKYNIIRINDLFCDLRIWYMRRNEVRKFNDKRRKNIYSKIRLTDEQQRDVDKLYSEYYGAKIPYTWHRHFTAYTGVFDVNYFPELLYIPEFENFMNLNKEFTKVFSDKNMLPLLAKAKGVKMPRTYMSATRGMYRDAYYRAITLSKAYEIMRDIGEIFIKPSVDSNSGKGCLIANIKDGTDVLSGKKIEALLDELGDDFVVQERLMCNSSIAKIYDGSVNTFRIITYRWKEEILVMPIIMRIGQGGNYLDNAHAGGMFIAVENDGTLHEKAFTEFKNEYLKHPDSGVVFKDYKIDNVQKVIESAKIMHEAIPQIGSVNWDFTIDDSGDAVLIEANLNGGSIWLIEMAHGVGAFGDKTREVLKWIRLMKRIPHSKRKKYMFGNMN